MGKLTFGLALLSLLGSAEVWACKTTALAVAVYDYEAMFTYLRKQPEYAGYTISKIEKEERRYVVSLETLNEVKCEVTLNVSNASDCVRTVTTFGESKCP